MFLTSMNNFNLIYLINRIEISLIWLFIVGYSVVYRKKGFEIRMFLFRFSSYLLIHSSQMFLRLHISVYVRFYMRANTSGKKVGQIHKTVTDLKGWCMIFYGLSIETIITLDGCSTFCTCIFVTLKYICVLLFPMWL